MAPYDDPRIDIPMLGDNAFGAFFGTLAANMQRELRTGHQLEPENLSPAEINLAEALMAAKVEFKQQHPFGPYSVDFYFESVALVVEVDGAAYHQDDVREARRDAYLLAHGAERVLHLRALEVFARRGECVAKIQRELARIATVRRVDEAGADV